MTQTTEKNPPSLIAYHVSDRGNGYWTRIGAAWQHKDATGFTLQLELVPLGPGRIVLRVNDGKPAGFSPEAAA